MNLRPPAFAGTFYPDDEDGLNSLIAQYIVQANPKNVGGELKALISPHAGYVYSGQTAAFGYKLLKGGGYRKIVIIGPSHRMMFQKAALSNFTDWRTPLGLVPLDPLSKKLQTESVFELLNEVHAFEHSVEVQLPFLQYMLDEFSIIPIVTGNVERQHKEIATVLNDHLDEETLIIASSDLSHYHPYSEAKELDKKTLDMIVRLDTAITHEQACGVDAVRILMELAQLNNWKPTLLDYRNSGDVPAGDKNEVVGYTAIAWSQRDS